MYLLDGLHEDLNKIKNKPYLPDLDFPQDTPDHIMAKESWKAYQKRNLSIITDLMMGQYKSVITCPEEGCNKVSTTFDPYLTWSVPISSKKRKFIDFKFLPFELGRIPYIIKLEITSEILSVTQLKALAEAKIGVTSQTCQFYYISRSIEKVQEDKITIKELRKKVKRSSYYELFLIEKSREETLILPEDSIEIYASFTHEEETSWSSAYKRTFFVRPFYFSQKDSAHSIHLKIFKYLRYFFENSDKNIELEEENSIKNLDEEAYKVVNADNACYLISWSPNYRGFDPCEFCGNKYCQGCKVEDDERINLQELLEKCKSSSCTSVNNIEIEIFWKPKKTFVTSLSKFMNNYQPFVKKSGLEMEDHKDEMEEEGLSLYDCMKLFSEPEQLDKENQWYCSNCKEHKLAKKQMSVYKAPKYLIIHLKRFKSKGSRSFYSYGNHGKANDLVKFPIKGLRLNDYVINHDKMEDYDNENNNEKNKPPVVYDLYAVSNHSGGLGGGHYYAYGKNAIKDSWYCFNDSSVREMNESEVITSGAYCLFYERRDSNQKKNIEFDIVKIKKEDKVKNSEKNEEKKENLIGSACRDDEYNISEAAPRKEILERINHNAS